MPIYEYQCPQCQNIFEEWLNSSQATAKAPCPECGVESSRIISNTAFVLKGGGWYVTEYGNRKQSNTGASSQGKSTAEAKTESSSSCGAQAAAAPAPTTNTGAAAGA